MISPSIESCTPEEVRYLVRSSPNLFAAFITGRKQGRIHVRMQKHWTTHRDSYVEVPRGHGKTVQMALRTAFDIGNTPSIRIKYIQQTDPEAVKTSKMVRAIVGSPRFRWVFPSVNLRRGETASGAWSVDFPGGGIQRDPTFEARGIFGRAGGRWDLIVADDICDLRNAVQQATLREQVKEAWANTWLPMADESADVRPCLRKVGTCYHVDDITADWRRKHGPDGSLLRCPCIGTEESPWPEVITPELLAERRADWGPVAYARAMLLEPVSSEVLIFPSEWLDAALYEPPMPTAEGPSNTIRVAALDFAFTEKRLGDGNPDYSVCLIGDRRGDGHLFATGLFRARLTYPEFRDRAIDWMKEAGVRYAYAEGNGPQMGLVQDFNRHAPFPVVGVPRATDKVTRAAEIQPFVMSGRYHLPAVRANGRLTVRADFQSHYDEVTTFPAGDHDDTVDTMIDLINAAATLGWAETIDRSDRRPSKSRDPRRMYQ